MCSVHFSPTCFTPKRYFISIFIISHSLNSKFSCWRQCRRFFCKGNRNEKPLPYTISDRGLENYFDWLKIILNVLQGWLLKRFSTSDTESTIMGLSMELSWLSAFLKMCSWISFFYLRESIVLNVQICPTFNYSP